MIINKLAIFIKNSVEIVCRFKIKPYLYSIKLNNMKNIKEKELNEINESIDSLNHLNGLIKIWSEKRGWHIFINRVNKKGWVVYGLQNGGRELMQYCGIGIIERYFDSPIKSLNEFINVNI